MTTDSTPFADEGTLFLGEACSDPLEAAIRERIRVFIEERIEEELAAALGRGRYQRRPRRGEDEAGSIDGRPLGRAMSRRAGFAGMVALREIDRRLGIADRLADCIGDPRLAERVRRSVTDIVGFRMMMQTRTQRRDVIAVDADSDEGARAFRDNGARDSDMMSPRADASLAVEFVTLRRCRRQSFEAVFAARLRRRESPVRLERILISLGHSRMN